ncbi:MAG: 30S ribosomal protein S8 [bacterium]|nr:30S ribosomal protein S8 [bacterium]
MDPIADMLTKIRNAQAVKKETVVIPYSKVKMEIAKLFLRADYIKEINRRGKKNKKSIELTLSYDEEGKPAISHLSRISKPSRRVYIPLKGMKPVRQGYGIMILSTSKGILTDKEAIKKKLGGEVLAEVW